MAGTLKAMREGGGRGVETGKAVATAAMVLAVGGDEVVLDERAMVEVRVSRGEIRCWQRRIRADKLVIDQLLKTQMPSVSLSPSVGTRASTGTHSRYQRPTAITQLSVAAIVCGRDGDVDASVLYVHLYLSRSALVVYEWCRQVER
jgi:hypothetical protein